MKSTRISNVYQKPFHFSTVQRDLIATLHADGLTGAHLDAWIPNTDEEISQPLNVGRESWFSITVLRKHIAKWLLPWCAHII